MINFKMEPGPFDTTDYHFLVIYFTNIYLVLTVSWASGRYQRQTTWNKTNSMIYEEM